MKSRKLAKRLNRLEQRVKDRREWDARIEVAGHRRHLGMFVDEVDAARAYDDASADIYGDRPNAERGLYIETQPKALLA